MGKCLAGLDRDSFIVSTKVGRYDVDTFDFSAERTRASLEEVVGLVVYLCLEFGKVRFGLY